VILETTGTLSAHSLDPLKEVLMYITRLDKVEKTTSALEGAKGVYKRIPLSKKDGVPTFSFRVFTIEPGGYTPFHQHEFEHMSYVIEGEGTLVSEDREHELREGDFALVLPEEKHQFRNSSENQNLVMICAVPKEYE
jgi:quercetin dioxygenase-like cupin family protein